MKVLLVDDEKTILRTLGDALADVGHEVRLAARGRDALDAIEETRFDCVISDLRLPDMSGTEIVSRARAAYPETFIIMITGHGSIESAVEAMKAGATEYVLKPFFNEDIVQRLERIGSEIAMREELSRLKSELTRRYEFSNLVGASDVMQRLFDQIRAVARNSYDVLVTGESGTGKELVARAVHHNSDRADGPFIAVSCAALPETMLEDELFGHEKGAFTDARERRIGRFELANGGTIFFDDIDDMKPGTQVKLLRVLQERSFERLGGEKLVEVDVRAVAATKEDLRLKVKKGEFREDLFYRLNVVPVFLPPLRARPEDIPVLVEHFIQKYAPAKSYRVEPRTYEAMAAYGWPGNVRELENAVKRSLALSTNAGVLSRKYLVPAQTPMVSAPSGPVPLKEVMAEAERAHIQSVLGLTAGNRTRAAEVLGISRKSLWEKMKGYGLL